jgi:hypothetical protein
VCDSAPEGDRTGDHDSDGASKSLMSLMSAAVGDDGKGNVERTYGRLALMPWLRPHLGPRADRSAELWFFPRRLLGPRTVGASAKEQSKPAASLAARRCHHHVRCRRLSTATKLMTTRPCRRRSAQAKKGRKRKSLRIRGLGSTLTVQPSDKSPKRWGAKRPTIFE